MPTLPELYAKYAYPGTERVDGEKVPAESVPVMFALPATCKRLVGLVVPMPTLPLISIPPDGGAVPT
jgi:hypothetical protein